MRNPAAARYPVTTFYLLAFGISWAGYLPLLAGQWGVGLFRSRLWMGGLILPAVGPAVAAGLVGWLAGERGVWTRWVGPFVRRVSWRWWVVATVGPAVLFLVANRLSVAWAPGGTWAEPASPNMAVLGALLVGFAANPWEEVGWRGFALRRLQLRGHPAWAAVLVGALWAFWHIPLFILSSSPMSHYPFGFWALGLLGRSIIMAWLYNRSSESLGVVTVWHVASNVFGVALGLKSFASGALVDLAAAGIVLVVTRGTLGFGDGGTGENTVDAEG